MIAVALALRTLLREWRSGELGVLVLAITVAVAALTGVGFLVNRIGIAVDNQAGEVLAADLRLESGQAMDDKALVEARRRGLDVARSTGLFSVVFNGDTNQLTSLRAVSEKYPLRGRVMLSDEPFGAPQPSNGIPARGEVWPDSRLSAALGAGVGTELNIGSSTFRVSRILITRPDQGATFLELAPSLIMNEDDLAATQLVQPGSRLRRAQLFAGPRDEIASFKTWLETNKKQNEEIEDVEDSAPQIKSAIDRSARFLSIASLMAVLLCAIAVAMAARRYVHRHLDSVALLKTLGATRAFTLTVSMVQLTMVGLLAAILGSLVGFGAQAWLVKALAGLLRGDLPAARSCAARYRVSHRDRRTGRIRAAAAAAVVAHACIARPASRCRAPAADGSAGVRPGGDCDRIPHLLDAARSAHGNRLRPRPRRHSSWWRRSPAGCSSSSRRVSAAAWECPGDMASPTWAGGAPRASCSSRLSRSAS